MEEIKTWRDFLDLEREKPYFQEILRKVASARANSEVFPREDQVFACFEKCPLEKTRVVILGQDPYHSAGQAHGLSFSVEKSAKIPPSLRNIFIELENDLGISPPNHGNLEDWAAQGVLLLNSSLTVESGQPASHANFGWEIFAKEVLRFLDSYKNSPVVFILWGRHAQKIGEAVQNPANLKIESAHPSPFSARRGFFNSKPFSRANEFLKNHNLTDIKW